MRMSWIKSDLAKEIASIFVLTLALLLLVDYFLGYTILHNAPIKTRNNAERGLGISHPIYHHTLASNYDGLASFDQQTEYRFCTNDAGFKDKCGAVNNIKNYDIAFLGDSFTEGIGLSYEKTFVGIIADRLPKEKIANLGVAWYSPSIYYLKLLDLLDKGYTFKELVVYIDISDIQNEANYTIVDGKVIDTIENTSKQQKFPLINFGLKGLKSRFLQVSNSGPHVKGLNLNDEVYKKNSKSAWTYDNNAPGFGDMGVQGAIDKSVATMEKLYEVCKKNNIKLSIGIYPWPGQLLYDVEESKQVKIWRDFCANKCANFYNSFPTLFKEAQSTSNYATISRNYFYGDMHFNEQGNQLIANDFLSNYKTEAAK